MAEYVQLTHTAQQVDDAVDAVATKADQDALEAETAAREAADQTLAAAVSTIPDPLGAYVVESASGGVASFDDGAGGLPLKSCVVQIEPVQEGSGDPSPDNVRPIKGWTGCTLSHSGEDTSAPTTYPINWESEAGTVYGGTLDVVTGEMVVDTLGKTPIATSQIAITSLQGNPAHRFYNYNFLTAAPADIDKRTTAISQRFVYSGNWSDENSMSIGSNGVPCFWVLKDGVLAEDTVAAFNSWATDTGLLVVYTLATPITYQLTPTEVRTLLGANNIWADTGDVSVEYRADPTTLYNKLTNAILSTGGNV